ncbi:tRNA lysidine(34) synthetase TilS [Clostridium sp. 'deep sea']|uniref:tRNA lysidine(34) synthetase TilS n=1 Tax=Clostridium sp. 'deep sea' TaxID=2779445 RepID=UPI001896861A|nr:tRNA lysidine(34) synthetase TilS [Clostridium sp. 'deep sea']QOR34524.1 tRNA lysidine(34) synthetase TilS [Clostridium sp. 'deep sea']
MSTHKYHEFIKMLTNTYQWPSGKTLIVAISGGPDSTCAMRVLHDLALNHDFKLHLAHLDHCLRGEHSDKDAEYVKSLAHMFKWDYTIEKANLNLIYEETQGSMQQVCRDVRMKFLQRVAKKVKAFGIAFGHNKGDQAETILQHLIRGSGLAGLTGMQIIEKNNDKLAIIRPLIQKTRGEILEMLDAFQLTYRQDASNKTDKYQRNHIRHNLIPFIEDNYNPQVIDRISDMSKVLKQDEDYLNEQALLLAQRALKETPKAVVVEIEILKSIHLALCTRVMRYAYRLLTGTTDNLSFEHSLKLSKLINSRHGDSISLPKEVTCEKVYDRLYLYYKDNWNESVNLSSIAIESPTTIELPDNKYLKIEIKDYNHSEAYKLKLRDVAYFDLDKVAMPIIARTRQNGDKFFPEGAPGKKKLKDFFIDKKIPKNSRNHLVLIVDNSGKILWITGLRRSQYAKITNKTKKVLALRIMEGE